jgi:hypothetical protein
MIEGCSTTAGYQALEGGFDNSFTDMHGASSTIQPYDDCLFTGGGKKKAKAKKRTPLRKPLSKKTKRMARMRVKSVKSVEKRQKKMVKRLKQRKVRTKVIDSLSKNKPLDKQVLSSLSPAMSKFVSKIPKGNPVNLKLSSGLLLDSVDNTRSQSKKAPAGFKAKSKSTRQKQFEDARKGLAEILKGKPLYAPKSKSVIKFSDFKSMPTQSKSKQRAKSKRKGNTR